MAKKSMAIAMLISFFLAGLGLVYADDIKKGLGFFALIVVFNILYRYVHPLFGLSAFIVWLFALYFTYKQVKLVNGE